MSWFEKLMPSRIRIDSSKDKKVIPEGVWEKCLSCQTVLYREDIVSNQYVCTNCGYHMRIKARERLDIFLDPDEKKELFSKLSSKDFLKFKDSKKYKDRISAAQKSTNEKDALLVMEGKINGIKVTYVSAIGTFMKGLRLQKKTMLPESQLLGAIIKGELGTVFIKAVGNKDLVKENENKFKLMISEGLKVQFKNFI